MSGSELERLQAKVAELEGIAQELNCTVAQLAIAWAALNPRVSSVITGASRLTQLQSNLAAVNVMPRITPEVKARIEALTQSLAA